MRSKVTALLLSSAGGGQRWKGTWLIVKPFLLFDEGFVPSGQEAQSLVKLQSRLAKHRVTKHRRPLKLCKPDLKTLQTCAAEFYGISSRLKLANRILV